MRPASEDKQAVFDGANGTVWSCFRTAGLSFLKLYRTRFELFLLDLEEEKERLERRLVLSVLAGVLAVMGSLVATAFFVWLLLPSLGIWAVALFAALYLGAAGAIYGSLKQGNKRRHRTFACTLQEFEKDGERFAEMFGDKRRF
jgi:uncharacterized membrane protein YqjE